MGSVQDQLRPPRPEDLPQAMDEIRVTLPGISEAEYEQRRRLRMVRTVAAQKIAELKPGQAVDLAWMATEVAQAMIFSPASIEHLTDVAEYCRRLLIVCDHASRLEGQR